MDFFYISSGVLGSEGHLEVSPTGFRVVSVVPPGSWLFNGSVGKASQHLCLDSLLRLENINVPSAPSSRWSTMMSTVGCVHGAPWSLVMPPAQYRSYVRSLINSIKESFDRISKDYCRATWMPCSTVFTGLKPAKVDSATYKSIVDAEGGGNGALETFKPGAGGYVPVVQYDRFGTRTGRLTVESGPNILTLRKDHRRILKSHFQGGRIVSLDFSALEARIILAEAGIVVGQGDLYEQISNDVFDGSIARNVVKVAVLSELYGASRASLEHRLEMGGADLDRFVAAIRSHFMTDVLRSRLKKELGQTGRIHNKFGRPLFLEQKNSDYLLVNTYAQSTGVDVSLLGFKSILDCLGTDGIRPLYVLHDALILDVRDDRISDVESKVNVKVPGYEQQFPLKVEFL